MARDVSFRLMPSGTGDRIDACVRTYCESHGIGGTLAERRRAWLIAKIAEDEATAQSKPPASRKMNPIPRCRDGVALPSREGRRAIDAFVERRIKTGSFDKATRRDAALRALHEIEVASMNAGYASLADIRRSSSDERVVVQAIKDLCAAGVVEPIDGSTWRRKPFGKVAPKADVVLAALHEDDKWHDGRSLANRLEITFLDMRNAADALVDADLVEQDTEDGGYLVRAVNKGFA